MYAPKQQASSDAQVIRQPSVPRSLIARFTLLIISALFFNIAFANTPVVNVSGDSPIHPQFSYIQDALHTLDLKTVLERPQADWQLSPTGSETFGITRSRVWLRFSIKNPSQHSTNLIAALAYSQLDDVKFFVFDGNTLNREFTTGDKHPFGPRDVNHPNMSLRLTLAPAQTRTIYVRVETNGSLVLPLRIWREADFLSVATEEQKLHFFYYGSLTIIILINFAVFLTLREKVYLYYALAISGYLLFFTSMSGYSFQHFYPDSPTIHMRAFLLSMPFLALFSVMFCREFLKTATYSPKLDWTLRAMVVFELCNMVAALTLSYNAAVIISALSAFVFFIILFVAGPITWAKGVQGGMFFTVAWTPLTIGVLAITGRSLGLFPDNLITQHAMQIGSGLEAFILTLALANRLYLEREDKISAQADSLQKEKAQHEAHNKLNEAMMHDSITGLPNRNRFEWMVNQQLQREPDHEYVIGIARVTRLDEVIRTLGLGHSEKILKRVAQQMSELASMLPSVHSVRDSKGRENTVYQLSGDSFGVLLRSLKASDNRESIKASLRSMSEPVVIDNLSIELLPRFGAAAYPKHGTNAAQLIRNAHVGMEIAPHGNLEAGFYAQKYDIYSESRLTLMSDLKDALASDQTTLFYQPKACLKTGNIVSVEALIRWHHPQRGWVYPNDFIPLAEETGIITQLTNWAFERALKDLAALHHLNPALGVSVNISARDLSTGTLNKTINAALKRHRISANRLTVELTETAAMLNPEQGLAVLKTLKDSGVHISIDDFGSGYSSLSYLKELPATEIKLDRSLIMDVCTSESSRVIVETSINMAHGLGYEVVAEGIETIEAKQLLTELNCERLQGYWLCRPLPLTELTDWLTSYTPDDPISTHTIVGNTNPKQSLK